MLLLISHVSLNNNLYLYLNTSNVTVNRINLDDFEYFLSAFKYI